MYEDKWMKPEQRPPGRQPLPRDWHEHKVRPLDDKDAQGWIPYEVYSRALGHIAQGKVKP